MEDVRKPKTTRRPKGSGSYWFSASENRWRASYTDTQGCRKSLSSASQAEIIQRLGEAQYGAPTASERLSPLPRRTVSSWLLEWLEGLTHLQPSTLRRYELDVNQRIIPGLGSVALDELASEQIHLWMKGLQQRGMSPASTRHSLAVLRSALSDAQSTGVLATNVARQVKPPKLKAYVAGTMTQDEVVTLLTAARKQGAARELRWRLALVWGLRQGEALGLQWQDFDRGKQQLHVRRSLAYVPGEGLRLQRPKTDGSARVLPLDGRTIDLFECAALEQSNPEDSLTVFKSTRHTPIHPRNDYRAWVEISHAILGRRLRLHDCRHFAVCSMLESGLDPQTVSTLVGHSSLTMTLGTYGRHLPSRRQHAVRLWAEIFA